MRVLSYLTYGNPASVCEQAFSLLWWVLMRDDLRFASASLIARRDRLHAHLHAHLAAQRLHSHAAQRLLLSGGAAARLVFASHRRAERARDKTSPPKAPHVRGEVNMPPAPSDSSCWSGRGSGVAGARLVRRSQSNPGVAGWGSKVPSTGRSPVGRYCQYRNGRLTF